MTRPTKRRPIGVDDRAGSFIYHSALRRLRLPAHLHRRRFGDIWFKGNGPKESTVSIGIEVKTVDDLLSAFLTKRLQGHQLPGLIKNYRYVYLLIQGFYRPASDGRILIWKPIQQKRGGLVLGVWKQSYSRVLYHNLEAFLWTLTLRCGVKVYTAWDFSHAVQFVQTTYSQWQKPWAKHHSHLALPDVTPLDRQGLHLSRHSWVRKFANSLDGIGWHRSLAVERHFKTIRQAANATVRDWSRIPGFGAGLSDSVEGMISGRKKERAL